MSAHDPELLRALAAADTPPPGGCAITPAHLHAAAARRARRHLAALAAVLAAAPLGWCLVPALPHATSTTPPADTVQALRADLQRLDRLLASLGPVAEPADLPGDPAGRVRLALARARADAVGDATASPTGDRR